MKLFWRQLTIMVAILVIGTMPLALAQEDGEMAHLVVVHGIEDGPAVDVYAGEVSGTPLIAALAAGESTEQLDLEAGTYMLYVVPAGLTSPVLLEAEITLDAQTTYEATVTGSLDEPALELIGADEMGDEGDMDGEDMGDDGDMAGDEDMGEPTGDVLTVVSETPSLSTLGTAIGMIGVTDAFSVEGPITVFAPSNDVFSANSDITGQLLNDLELAAAVLSNHLVDGLYTAEDLMGMDGETLTSLSGNELAIAVVDDMVTVNGATVVEADLMATNGVIHVIDAALLTPEMMTDMGGDEADMGTETDEGDMGDEDADMGDDEAETMLGEEETLMDVLIASGADFSQLKFLVSQADFGVFQALIGEGPLTVFAPTNAAFEMLPPGLVEQLVGSRVSVTAVLQSHVVPQALTLEELAEMDGEELTTAFPAVSLTVSVDEDGNISLLVMGDEENAVQVGDTELSASNGNIIVIESVIVPPRPQEGMGGDGDAESSSE